MDSDYVNDVFAIIRKRSSKTVLEKINSCNGPLNFTLEEMKDDKLTFIDCEIFIDANEIKFRKFWKNGLGTVTSNHKKSVTPKKYLNNNFTKIHSIRNVT